jgi:hypothetical protein
MDNLPNQAIIRLASYSRKASGILIVAPIKRT